jgi:hypothetical protein
MFTTKLKIEAVERRNNYVLTDQLVYITADGDDKIVVPSGFETNFASVPSFAKVYIDDDDYEIRSPSVVHDYLYSKRSFRLGYSRKEADGILREAMIGEGMRRSKAGFIYYILRWFGGSNYEDR